MNTGRLNLNSVWLVHNFLSSPSRHSSISLLLHNVNKPLYMAHSHSGPEMRTLVVLHRVPRRGPTPVEWGIESSVAAAVAASGTASVVPWRFGRSRTRSSPADRQASSSLCMISSSTFSSRRKSRPQQQPEDEVLSSLRVPSLSSESLGNCGQRTQKMWDRWWTMFNWLHKELETKLQCSTLQCRKVTFCRLGEPRWKNRNIRKSSLRSLAELQGGQGGPRTTL
jgi:hypothetical protein